MALADEYPYKGDVALAAFLMSLIERGFSQYRATVLMDAIMSDSYPNRSRIIKQGANALGVTKEKLIELGGAS